MVQIRLGLVFILLFLVNLKPKLQDIQVETGEEGILFLEGKDSVLFYRTKPVASQGSYARSNYIHPLYGLSGDVITEDYPADHPHHHGVFWAWHQLYVGQKRIGDGWENRDVFWLVDSVKQIDNAEGAKTLKANVTWKSPLLVDKDREPIRLISEEVMITVYPGEETFRIIDITISLLALCPNMRIGGAENEKGYGGFSARIRLSDSVMFSGSAGIVSPENLPVAAGGWMNIISDLGTTASGFGVCIFNHPSNPGYANPWILRSKRSMQNVVYPYPGATAVELSDKNPTVLHYRLVIHEKADAIVLSELYAQFSQKEYQGKK